VCRTLLEFRLRTLPVRPQLRCQPGTPLAYAEATWSQKLENWIGSHIRAFEFYGGCPKLIVPDTGPNAKFRVAPCQRERNPPAGPEAVRESVPKPAFFKSWRSFLILFRFQTKLEVRRTGTPDVSLRIECRCPDASPPASESAGCRSAPISWHNPNHAPFGPVRSIMRGLRAGRGRSQRVTERMGRATTRCPRRSS
jgi:hypothetical protein